MIARFNDFAIYHYSEVCENHKYSKGLKMEKYYKVDTDEFVRLCRNLKLWRDSRQLTMSLQLSCLMGNALE